MPCEAQMLKEVELFEHLTDEDRVRLAEVVDLQTLAAGTTLSKAGEPGESLYVVKSGEGELFIKDTTGQKIELPVCGCNEILGKMVLLARGARTATAVALSDPELPE